MAGNERFRTGQPQPRDLVARARRRWPTSRHPKAMVLACSDSRVAPEIIFDQRLGDLFVVRVAGNVADKLAIGSLEFAAEHLARFLAGRHRPPALRGGRGSLLRRQGRLAAT